MINSILKWTGCVVCCLGALVTSLNPILPLGMLGIYLLNLGSLSYLIWSIRIGELNLIVTNGFILACWSVGIIATVV